MQDYALKESYILPLPYSTGNGTYKYNPEGTRAVKEQLNGLNAVTVGFTTSASGDALFKP